MTNALWFQFLVEMVKFKLCFSTCNILWTLARMRLGQILTLQKVGAITNFTIQMNIIALIMTMALNASLLQHHFELIHYCSVQNNQANIMQQDLMVIFLIKYSYWIFPIPEPALFALFPHYCISHPIGRYTQLYESNETDYHKPTPNEVGVAKDAFLLGHRLSTTCWRHFTNCFENAC
ncbi:hypothetical protein EDB19DRAFT_1826915 [Suillus lakei]|nr:hypothetical protein EDB19DRAFT_1826915 [Suillus lakei]